MSSNQKLVMFGIALAAVAIFMYVSIILKMS